eukprot:473359-Rhodomonas_salina.1
MITSCVGSGFDAKRTGVWGRRAVDAVEKELFGAVATIGSGNTKCKGGFRGLVAMRAALIVWRRRLCKQALHAARHQSVSNSVHPSQTKSPSSSHHRLSHPPPSITGHVTILQQENCRT